MKRKVLFLLFSFFLLSFSSNAQVVSLTGVGATGGWGDGFDADMQTTDGNIFTLVDFVMPGGECKFRLNNAWDTAWGGTSFPAGVGDTTPGGPNILAVPGTYTITFNLATAEYFFEGAPIPTVNLIGATVAAPFNMSTADAITYTATNVTLLGGDAQFEIDGDAFGDAAFPSGILSDPSVSIPTVAGVYSSITVNINDGTYNFVAAPIFNVVSITGSAVGGWGDGFDFDMTTTDGITYTYSGLVTAVGEVKFRLNNAWTVSYGGTGFPSGTATTDSPSNIPVNVAGTYSVTFNLVTGEYAFAFPVISLTGSAFGGWGDGFDFNMMTTDGINYTMGSITSIGGEGKFRLDNQWTTSWGSADFPSGTATTDSPTNIAIPAGVYGVNFNRENGAFAFGPELATTSFNASNFRAFPNPTQNDWNFTSATEKIQTIQIIDMLGKVVKTVTVNSTAAKVEASDLNSGMYFAKVVTAAGTSTVKVVKN